MSVLVSGTSLSKALVNLSHSGLSKLSLNSLSFYFVGQTEPKILRLVYWQIVLSLMELFIIAKHPENFFNCEPYLKLFIVIFDIVNDNLDLMIVLSRLSCQLRAVPFWSEAPALCLCRYLGLIPILIILCTSKQDKTMDTSPPLHIQVSHKNKHCKVFVSCWDLYFMNWLSFDELYLHS